MIKLVIKRGHSFLNHKNRRGTPTQNGELKQKVMHIVLEATPSRAYISGKDCKQAIKGVI